MRFIAAENIPALLKRLAADGTVWAPRVVADAVNTVLFKPWSPGDPVETEAFTTLSAKELVLPATERLFAYRYAETGAGETIEIEPEAPGGPAVLFGARACDAKALAVLDALFVPENGNREGGGEPGAGESEGRPGGGLESGGRPGGSVDSGGPGASPRGDDKSSGEPGAGESSRRGAAPGSRDYNDPGYRERRAGLTVITLACTTCDSACFCSSFANGPAETAGSDLILYPVAGGYLAESVTGAGRELAAVDIFTDSDMEKPPLAETARVDLTGLGQKFLDVFADLELWQAATEQCLSCGLCTYACPACHCFNIFDEMSGDREGERCRSWDACMFYTYTLETSGHNPRPEIAHRYRNRTGHKFSYYPENRGEFLCTGCGRCIRGCPAGVDIREIIKAVQER